MDITVNLRNNTNFFIKVAGIDEVIAPNTELEDKTIQWKSSVGKEIKIFSTVECTNPAICVGNIQITPNSGIFVDRGDITGVQSVILEANVEKSHSFIKQVENGGGGKLLDWADVTALTEVTLSFNKKS